jgi:hypothetical protein
MRLSPNPTFLHPRRLPLPDSKASTPRGEAGKQNKPAPAPSSSTQESVCLAGVVGQATEIVDLLKSLLKRAETGEIQSIAVVAVNPTGRPEYIWRTGPQYGNPPMLLAGINMMQVKLAVACEG